MIFHLLFLQGNKAMRSIEPTESSSVDESSMSVSSAGNFTKLTSTSADSPSPTSTLTSAYEDVESGICLCFMRFCLLIPVGNHYFDEFN